MKKSWGLIPKILAGRKTVESRWYKTRRTPWDKIQPEDNLYFKDSGEPVTVKTQVTKVLQFEISDNNHALEIMKKYAQKDLGLSTIPPEIKNYILNKRYAIFVFFNHVKKIKPFKINKTGFGMMSAWITIDDINNIKQQ